MTTRRSRSKYSRLESAKARNAYIFQGSSWGLGCLQCHIEYLTVNRGDTARIAEPAWRVPASVLVLEAIKEFLQVLLFFLQELDLRIACPVEGLACGRLSKLTIQAADLAVGVVELMLKDPDLLIGLVQLGVAFASA